MSDGASSGAAVTRPIFTGLSAFPLTPADPEGIVDTDGLGVLLERLVAAGVASIGLLGSTGVYPYLDREQRGRAVAAAVECVRGRTPIIVGVGALRTSWAQELARDAARAGTDGLLLAPMTYAPLTEREVADHFEAVAGATELPLCIYNNPGTTRFVFSEALLAQLAALPNIAAVKMPLPPGGDFAAEIARLREVTSDSFEVGYSGDWGIVPALSAGANAFYSGLAGVLPDAMLRLARAATGGSLEQAQDAEAVFAPMWAMLRAYGGMRVSYAVCELLSLRVGVPPLPLQRLDREAMAAVGSALQHLCESKPEPS